MLFRYSRRLTGKVRSFSANAELACFLSFIAGAINAGGFLAVQHYTSHMSGIVSNMADMLAVGNIGVVLWGFGALLAFMTGSATTTIVIHYARHHHMQSEYAFPIFLEAGALIVFGLLDGIQWQWGWLWTSLTVASLCYIMGLQNAIITDISQYALRSTHVTGTVTDIGIEFGKLFYWNRTSKRNPSVQPVRVNRQKFRLLLNVLLLFFIGGLVGAFGFKYLGFMFTVAIAGILVLIASGPLWDDLVTLAKRFNNPPIVLGNESSTKEDSQKEDTHIG